MRHERRALGMAAAALVLTGVMMAAGKSYGHGCRQHRRGDSPRP